MQGGKTPNPYAMGPPGPSGGRTPAYGAYGRPESSGSRPSAMPPPAAPYSAPYSAPTPAGNGAPTPAVPGNPYTAPTPYGAPTPYAAPTPGMPALSAPTPGPGTNIAPTPFGAPTPYGAQSYGASAQQQRGRFACSNDVYNEHCSCCCLGLPWDWALDFRNVIVEIGPSYRPGSRNPLHFKRGFFDGKRFGYNDIIGESVRAILLDDPSIVEEIPAEYLRPAKADSQGQVVVVIGGGPEQKGQQRTTQYENGGSWMMELEGGDMAPLVVDGADLCRIWKV